MNMFFNQISVRIWTSYEFPTFDECCADSTVSDVRLKARAIRIPIDRPTRMSTRTLDAREFVLVYAGADDADLVGVGFTYAGTSGGVIIAEIINTVLANVVVERGSTDIVGTWEAMFQESLLLGRRGAVLRAMSAVDIALWDLAAKRAGVPLAVHLGGSVHDIPAYASGGYYRQEPAGWADAVTREITLNREQGFVDHKIKVGGLSVEEDEKRVAAAIDAIAGSGRLALDANNAYGSPSEAQRAAEAFERAAGETGLWWLEEPLSVEDVRGLARVRDRISTPIATGEIAQTRHDFRILIEAGAADILQPDAGVLGGVTEYMRVVRAAETFGVTVAPHWHANLHVHLAAASTTSLAVEHFTLDKDIYNFEKLIVPESRLQVVDGMAKVPERPGLGLEFDEDMIRTYELPVGVS
jgi:L-alanine-DL-glutamate epimerase-like enolase superfamily enzyme